MYEIVQGMFQTKKHSQYAARQGTVDCPKSMKQHRGMKRLFHYFHFEEPIFLFFEQATLGNPSVYDHNVNKTDKVYH
jgi:hypothetical protein